MPLPEFILINLELSTTDLSYSTINVTDINITIHFNKTLIFSIHYK